MLDEQSVRPSVLLDLIDHLSPSASLWRAIDPDVAWGMEPMLLALIVDEIRVLRWEFERVNFKGRPPRPEQVPRPGVGPAVDRAVYGGATSAVALDEMAAWLGWAQGPGDEPL